MSWEAIGGIVAAVAGAAGTGGWSWAFAGFKALKAIRKAARQHGDPHLQNILNQAKTLAGAAGAIEASGSSALKKLISVEADVAGPLVAMALKSAAASADPKTSKRPVNVVKRIGAAVLGNVLCGLFRRRR